MHACMLVATCVGWPWPQGRRGERERKKSKKKACLVIDAAEVQRLEPHGPAQERRLPHWIKKGKKGETRACSCETLRRPSPWRRTNTHPRRFILSLPPFLPPPKMITCVALCPNGSICQPTRGSASAPNTSEIKRWPSVVCNRGNSCQSHGCERGERGAGGVACIHNHTLGSVLAWSIIPT